jgi:hypothetical protein
MRAILFASAMATTLNGRRARSCVSHGYAYDLDRLFRAERRPQNTDLGAYLVRLTASVTGAPEAEKRVDTVIAQARDNIRKARRSGVILSFMAGAAALAGAAVAWFAACAGGQHRDAERAPSMMWGIRPPPCALTFALGGSLLG